MQTEEEFGQRIGDWLRAEIGDLEVNHDVMLAGIRRRRRTVAVRAGLAVSGTAVVVAAAGTTLAASGAQPSGVAHTHVPTASAPRQMTRVQLAGYLVSLPAGLHVQKIGRGYLVHSPAGEFAIFLENGPNFGPGLGRAGVVQVRSGGMTGWWLGNSKRGVLWLRRPSWPPRVYLIAKVIGATESQTLAFAATLEVSTTP